MKIDITSMFFNSKIEGKTATPAWRTSIGQNKSKDCRIETDTPGVVEAIIGMNYRIQSDLSKLDLAGTSGELLLCSLFQKVFVDGVLLPDAKYILLLLKEESESHKGRLSICYSPNISYDGYKNANTISQIAIHIGCKEKGCWFVHDISVRNQDEIHFSTIVVDKDKEVVYQGTSKNRSALWKSLVQNSGEASVSITKILLPLNEPLQQIYYGAPGTGKSHQTNDIAGKYFNTIRTTFHPDSDYSTFVGVYKPTMEEVEVKTVPVVVAGGITLETNKGTFKEKRISYKFVKQAFLKAYTNAWKLFASTCVEGREVSPQFLIIEEINRGYCAQIFGDLFQLLDRKEGFSEYPIEADEDIRKALLDIDSIKNPSFGEDGLQLSEEQKIFINSIFNQSIAEKISNGQLLVLPPNLYIWATMNTSDQSLFPIDSAFKRRWEWKYMKIKEGKDENGNSLDWKIVVKGADGNNRQINGEDSLSWWTFIQKINDIIASMTSSADKQLGYFFCKAKDGVISGDKFVSKVVFYLWNDVFKDYGFEDASLFRYETVVDGKSTEKDLTFPDFYDEEGENINADRLVDFLEKVLAWQKPEDNA